MDSFGFFWPCAGVCFDVLLLCAGIVNGAWYRQHSASVCVILTSRVVKNSIYLPRMQNVQYICELTALGCSGWGLLWVVSGWSLGGFWG